MISTDNEIAISCRGLGYTYGREFSLRDITFEIKTGETLCVLGPNGCGKTTLLALLAGSLVPLSGEAYLFGENLHRHMPEAQRLISYMPFRAPVSTLKTPFLYWQAIGFRFGHTFKDSARRAAHLAPRMNLSRRIHKNYYKLSLGMMQKTALVGAFLPDAPVRILDEPFSGGIDPLAMEALTDWMEKGRAAGETIIFSSQMTEHAERLADRVLVIRDGRIAAFGAPDEIIANAGLTGNDERPFAQAYIAVAEEGSRK